MIELEGFREVVLVISIEPVRRSHLGLNPRLSTFDRRAYPQLPDEDAGPTKAWIVTYRDEPKWKSYFDHAYDNVHVSSCLTCSKIHSK